MFTKHFDIKTISKDTKPLMLDEVKVKKVRILQIFNIYRVKEVM